MAEHEPTALDAELWDPGGHVVPPVIGRPSLHYDTEGEVTPDDPELSTEEYDDDGVSITITF